MLLPLYKNPFEKVRGELNAVLSMVSRTCGKVIEPYQIKGVNCLAMNAYELKLSRSSRNNIDAMCP